MANQIIGYVLSADTTGATIGCRMNSSNQPKLGEMIKIPSHDSLIYGIITNILILDDGLVRQLATTTPIQEGIIQDNRENRTVPMEFHIVFIGHKRDERIFHLLPPQPPLSLESVTLCTPTDMLSFSSSNRFGYLRYLVAQKENRYFDVVAAHFELMNNILPEDKKESWKEGATRSLVHLYRSDYEMLSQLLHTLADTSVFTDR